MLDLIRQLQRIPNSPLPLTFFDDLGYEQLRDLHRSYHALVEHDPDQAQRHLESFLLSVAVGVTPVHQIRRIDPNFIPDYMLPQLEEDEIIGGFAASLATMALREGDRPSGVDALLTTEEPQPEDVNIRGLIDAVTPQRDKRVRIEGTSIVLERDDVRDAVKAAIITGIKEKRRDENEADKLQAPVEAVKNAIRQLDRCAEACRSVLGGSEFDDKRRKSLEAAFKKLKRTYRALETELIKSNVIAE